MAGSLDHLLLDMLGLGEFDVVLCGLKALAGSSLVDLRVVLRRFFDRGFFVHTLDVDHCLVYPL